MAASIARQEIFRKLVGFKLTDAGCLGYIQVRFRTKQNVRYRAPHESTKASNVKWMAKKHVLQSKPKDTRGTDNPLWKSKVPTDDVWIRLYYPKQSQPFPAIIQKHRECAVPEILDSEKNLLYADMTLNMTTAKKTKFLGVLKSIAHIPHPFEDKQQKRCIVFSENLDVQKRALQLGAVEAGGKDLVKRLLEGELKLDDFEYVLSTPDILTQLIPVRTMLRDRFPIKQKGNLSHDVDEMMKRYSQAIGYKSQKVSNEISTLQVPFGQLHMPMEHLEENFVAIVESVTSHRPVKLGPMITKTQIVCPPSEERFNLELGNYVPGYVSEEPPQLTEPEPEQTVEEDSDEESPVAAKS